MSINIALSGMNAASSDLRVAGNNIANASTTGFKASRAEFADVYASTSLGAGSSQIGAGVKLANVAQRFDQGNITFTNNNLDLAIDGNGFFVLNDDGTQKYTRNGAFAIDAEGFLTSNATGARVQGFTASVTGTLSGILGDLSLDTSDLPPLQTTLVDAGINLDARSAVLSELGNILETTGTAVGVAQLGIPEATSTELNTAGAPTPFDFSIDTQSTVTADQILTPFDFSGAAASSFEIQLTGSSVPTQNITATVNLDSNIFSMQSLIDEIRDDLLGSGIGIDVREDPANVGRLQFFAVNTGENSTIIFDPNDNASFGTGVAQADIEAVLGGIALGQAGGAGASNVNPDPYGGTATAGIVGNRSAASFDLTLSGSSGVNGTVTIDLTANITDLDTLILDIEDQLLLSGINVAVQPDPADSTRLQFISTIDGEPSTIQISNLDTANIGVNPADLANVLNLAGPSTPGIAAADNGYNAQTVEVVYPNGQTVAVNIDRGASARSIVGAFSNATLPDIEASATTTAIIPAGSYRNTSGTLEIAINGQVVSGDDLQAIANTINLGVPGLASVRAEVNGGDLYVTDQVGNDLVFSATGDAADSLEVIGTQGVQQSLDTSGTSVVAVGGTVEFVLGEGIVLENAVPSVTNLFGVLGPGAYEATVLNTFDPNNQETYNAATSLTVFDSLGNAHALSLYFVKERFTPGVPGEEENRWSVYTLIDGADIGDPNPDLLPPADTQPTRARFDVQFNSDGTINPNGTETILISNWIPLDAEGDQNGAVGPQNVFDGGALPIEQPPTSSNFEIRLSNSTQFERDFSLGQIEQNGFATGRLSGMTIDDEGVLVARFTNGQNQVLGQVAIADFNSVQGLSAVGDTAWIETNDSGPPLISSPGSGRLGRLTPGALEDSNVELSEQLVQLIIAQRNFQANSRTISTVDEITQTIINI